MKRWNMLRVLLIVGLVAALLAVATSSTAFAKGNGGKGHTPNIFWD